MKKIKRVDINSVDPKKLKPFDKKEFIKMATELKKAVEKEERKYGPLDRDPRFI